MILYCSNPDCDFEYDDSVSQFTNLVCPKCRNTSFQFPKYGFPLKGIGTIKATQSPFTIPFGVMPINLKSK